MIYIIIDPEDGFIHMVTTNKRKAREEFAALNDPTFELREYVDE
jgi:hypothetical protein